MESLTKLNLSSDHPLIEKPSFSGDFSEDSTLSMTKTPRSVLSSSFLTVSDLNMELPEVSGGTSLMSPIDHNGTSNEMFAMDPLGSLDDEYMFETEEGEDMFSFLEGLGSPPLSRTNSGNSEPPPTKLLKVETSSKRRSDKSTKSKTEAVAVKSSSKRKSAKHNKNTATTTTTTTTTTSKTSQAPTGDRRGRKNFRERQRRQTMNEKFDELTRLVETTNVEGTEVTFDPKNKMRKMDVLAKAINTIKDLQEQVEVLELERMKLRNGNNTGMLLRNASN